MSVPPPNVKVYDRPERKAPTPIVMVIALLVVVIVGFLLFKALHHDSTTSPTNARPGVFLTPTIVQREVSADRSECLLSVRSAPDAPIYAWAVS